MRASLSPFSLSSLTIFRASSLMLYLLCKLWTFLFLDGEKNFFLSFQGGWISKAAEILFERKEKRINLIIWIYYWIKRGRPFRSKGRKQKKVKKVRKNMEKIINKLSLFFHQCALGVGMCVKVEGRRFRYRVSVTFNRLCICTLMRDLWCWKLFFLNARKIIFANLLSRKTF